MARNRELADRVRDALADRPSVREVKMFGGLSFMVNDRMVVSVRGDEDLLVRADPELADQLLSHHGAQPAEMGSGRTMGGGWISVAGTAIEGNEDFDFWIGVALEYNDKNAVRTQSRGRPQKGRR